jgi:hypothetical protein
VAPSGGRESGLRGLVSLASAMAPGAPRRRAALAGRGSAATAVRGPGAQRRVRERSDRRVVGCADHRAQRGANPPYALFLFSPHLERQRKIGGISAGVSAERRVHSGVSPRPFLVSTRGHWGDTGTSFRWFRATVCPPGFMVHGTRWTRCCAAASRGPRRRRGHRIWPEEGTQSPSLMLTPAGRCDAGAAFPYEVPRRCSPRDEDGAGGVPEAAAQQRWSGSPQVGSQVPQGWF